MLLLGVLEMRKTIIYISINNTLKPPQKNIYFFLTQFLLGLYFDNQDITFILIYENRRKNTRH